jgi:hypothetical protein
MKTINRRRIRLFAGSASAALVAAFATPSGAAEGSAPQIVAQAGNPAGATDDRQILLQRLQQFEQRLNQLEGRGGAPSTAPQAAPGNLDTQAILDRLDEIDHRLTELETNTVESAPKTIVKQVEVYVDQNGTQYDTPQPGTHPEITYQRERVFRRQTVDDAIAEALANQAATGINLGVSSVTTVQAAIPTKRPPGLPPTRVYGLSQADVTFLAKSAALNTSFFADLVAIGGPSPDREISSVSLLNSQTARLTNNSLQTREAWIRTELGPNQLFGITVGQIDLTNYFDRNAVANDETSQFISDALVNNQVLGLTNNGLGAVVLIDPKSFFNFKLGVQESNPNATSLSQGLVSLAEGELIGVPFGLGEGHYRLWGRVDNTYGDNRYGWGISIDQRITPTVTLFGRYGSGFINPTVQYAQFFSFGAGFQSPFSLNPLDKWGIGYAQTEIRHGAQEKLGEVFYNLHLTEHLEASAMLQYAVEHGLDAQYLIPSTRLKISF